MTDDIVVELRGVDWTRDTLLSAADEIERLRAELAVANVRLDDAMRNKDIITDWYDKASAERDALRAELAAERVQHKSIHEMLCKEVDELEAERDALRAVLAKIRRDYSSAFMPEDAARIDAALNKGGGDG